ncbi:MULTISPECIES: conjugal transfer protein TraM [Aromatoleum]|uniref:TraM protein of DNA transfer system n=2 Tax=Aromatoleum TaxID=551759 RepID=Q5NWI4_AROAE|nr:MULTISPECIES: conjugal transfer protein TraM [Aromatoleum]MCK0509539.1 conjugal transfer protein TraM [Aromatoleum buckelii]CAI10580.1 TraM protein of DNA transfer system [Aromatoleum aromaticum EbN1]
MSDKIESIIKEIAAKHGIAVGRDDPILVLQTINERLMQDSAVAQQETLDRFKEELESIAQRWGEDAKSKAERTLNAALTASKETMMKGMQEGTKAAAESARCEVEAAVGRLAGSVRASQRIAIMNMIAGALAVFAAAMALLSTL